MDEKGTGNPSDWSKPQEVDLECLPPLDPCIQEFCKGHAMPMAGKGVVDGLQQTSTPKPSPERNTKWIKWHAQQLDTPAWLPELREVPSQDDIWEFARMVWVSFQVPRVRCHASKVDNDYFVPPAPHSLDMDHFLPIQDM